MKLIFIYVLEQYCKTKARLSIIQCAFIICIFCCIIFLKTNANEFSEIFVSIFRLVVWLILKIWDFGNLERFTVVIFYHSGILLMHASKAACRL